MPKVQFRPWRLGAILLLCCHTTIPVALHAQDTSPTDQITITRLGYRATKMAMGMGTFAVARELGMGKTGAAIVATAAPVAASKLLYVLRGQPGGRWPSAGFALRDIGSELVETSAPVFMVWAHRGGKKAWWRWPVAAAGYGTLVAMTWSWGAP